MKSVGMKSGRHRHIASIDFPSIAMGVPTDFQRQRKPKDTVTRSCRLGNVLMGSFNIAMGKVQRTILK